MIPWLFRRQGIVIFVWVQADTEPSTPVNQQITLKALDIELITSARSKQSVPSSLVQLGMFFNVEPQWSLEALM